MRQLPEILGKSFKKMNLTVRLIWPSRWRKWLVNTQVNTHTIRWNGLTYQPMTSLNRLCSMCSIHVALWPFTLICFVSNSFPFHQLRFLRWFQHPFPIFNLEWVYEYFMFIVNRNKLPFQQWKLLIEFYGTGIVQIYREKEKWEKNVATKVTPFIDRMHRKIAGNEH